MRLKEIEARLAAIAQEAQDPNADLDALETEVRSLKEERKSILDTAERRRALIDDANANGIVVRDLSGLDGGGPSARTYDASSPEYRSAFLKNLLGVELSAEERAAFIHTTTNTPALVPTTMLNNIWDMVSTQHSIMGDITIYRTGTVLEVVKHTAIVQGDATIVAEAEANDDEQNTFVKVTLSGKDFSKHVDISYAMERMSVDSLESYLTSEIARQLGAAMAADVIAQIESDMAPENVIESATAGEVSFSELAAVFGSLERVSDVRIYAKRSTIYRYLVGMVDASGRPIFQPSAQAGAAGTLLGAQIRPEDSVADGDILIGDPTKVVYNMVQDIMIESAKDIKKHVTTYSGYARGQGALVDSTAFAKLTVATA